MAGAPLTPESSEGRKLTPRSSLEILAERASNAKPNTLLLPSPESEAKGFIIKDKLNESPLTVGDQVFSEGSLVAILRQDSKTRKYTLEFRIYKSVQGFEEQGTQDVAFLLRDPIGKQEGLYTKATPGSQLTIRRLTAAAIATRRSG